jgi:TBC1 domain family member 15
VIELIPILTRAESLFRRFERTVQAIDKKNNFPLPSLRQRKTDDDAAGIDKGKSPQQAAAVSSSSSMAISSNGSGDRRDAVISPELRQLLSKEIITVGGKDATMCKLNP